MAGKWLCLCREDTAQGGRRTAPGNREKDSPSSWYPGKRIRMQNMNKKPGTCTNRKKQMLHIHMKCLFSLLKTLFKASLIISTPPRWARTANISGLPMKQSQGREVIWWVTENFKRSSWDWISNTQIPDFNSQQRQKTLNKRPMT